MHRDQVSHLSHVLVFRKRTVQRTNFTEPVHGVHKLQ